MSQPTEDPIRERFLRDTDGHEMAILREDGLYRHLRYANPRYNGIYAFDILTWPNGLLLRGDGPNFVFSLYPTADLFEMFRGSSHGGINPGYWSQKVQAGEIKSWSEEKFRTWLTAKAADADADRPGLAESVKERILESDNYDLEYEECARYALEYFSFDGYQLRFPLKWEQDFDDWSWEYLWACHAIVAGIRQYDAAKASAALPVRQKCTPGELKLLDEWMQDHGDDPGAWPERVRLAYANTVACARAKGTL